MLYADLPPWTLMFFKATDAKTKHVMCKHVKCAYKLKRIAMNDLVCTYCSCGSDIHALLHRL